MIIEPNSSYIIQKIESNILAYDSFGCARALEEIRRTLKEHPELRKRFSWLESELKINLYV